MSDKQVKQNPSQEDRIQAEVVRLNKIFAALSANKKSFPDCLGCEFSSIVASDMLRYASQHKQIE